MIKHTMKALGVAAIALAVAACSEKADEPKEAIKIAVAGPFSGPLAQFGEMQISGAKKAVADLNAAGGLLERPVELVELDDVCEPKQATTVANQVVSAEISFVIGHLCSSSTLPASDVYEDAGVVMITPASTNPEITERGYEYVFRTVGRDDQQGPFAAGVVKSLAPTNVAVVHDKSAYGEGLASQVNENLKSMGVNVVMYEAITAGEADYSPLIAKLKAESIDLMFFGGYDPELAKIMRQGRDGGWTGQFVGGDGVSNNKIVEAAGEAADGLIATQPKSYDGEASNAALVAEFEALGVNASDTFVLPSYAAVMALSEAITAAGTADTAAVKDALRKQVFSTAVGNIQWDGKGDIVGGENTFAAYLWKKDGTAELKTF